MVIKDTLPQGCMGNKSRELKLLLPIIEQHITKDTIFIEFFCGSCIVSFNIYIYNMVLKYILMILTHSEFNIIII